jgi:hypothetical protein
VLDEHGRAAGRAGEAGGQQVHPLQPRDLYCSFVEYRQSRPGQARLLGPIPWVRHAQCSSQELQGALRGMEPERMAEANAASGTPDTVVLGPPGPLHRIILTQV